MKNPYNDPLSSFTFDEMLGFLSAINVETQLLDFKQTLPARKLAYQICAFANADGGIIALGFDNPVEGQDLRLSDDEVEIGDAAHLRIYATTNAWVYPAPRFDVYDYSSADRTRCFMIVRIEPSKYGPVEYLGSDETFNFPVRRGCLTKRLSLHEIESLLEQKVVGSAVKALPEDAFVRVGFEQSGLQQEVFIAVKLEPAVAGPRRIMTVRDDRLVYDIERRTRGEDSSVHLPMAQHETFARGVWMHTSSADPNVMPALQLEVRSNGAVGIRFRQTPANAMDQYVSALLTAYAAGQEIFYAFKVSPRARGHLKLYFGSEAIRHGIPAFFSDDFDVDLSRQSFAEAFADTTMLMMRSSNQPTDRDAVREILERYAQAFLPYVVGLEGQWLR